MIATNRKHRIYLFWSYPFSRQWGIGIDQLLLPHLGSGVLYVEHRRSSAVSCHIMSRQSLIRFINVNSGKCKQ